MTTKNTYKNSLKLLLVSLVCFFLGPIIIYSAFKNTTHKWFLPVVILGVIICFLAVFFVYKGLRGVVRTLFGKDNSKH